jgi:hypothetical protein
MKQNFIENSKLEPLNEIIIKKDKTRGVKQNQ